MRRSSGFTIVEIIVVLLLMSILAATLLGRSITSSTIDLNSATDKIRNQLRYAQSQAMKRSDAVWGIQSDGSSQYWLFRATPDSTVDVVIPGGDYASGSTQISFSNLKASFLRRIRSSLPAFSRSASVGTLSRLNFSWGS